MPEQKSGKSKILVHRTGSCKMSRHRGPSESSVGSIRRQGSDAAPCQRGIVAEPALEQTGTSMILEYPNIAQQGVHQFVRGNVHHLENRRALARRRRKETGPRGMPRKYRQI